MLLPQHTVATEKKKLLGGVAVLMPATLFTKLVGLFYKIPLIAIVGVGGMAYFLAAYHVYSLLFVLSATGLPTALSLQIARTASGEARAGVARIFRVSLALFLSLGILGTALLLWGAPLIAARIAMHDATAAIVAIAPALFLSAFIGAAKGFFQGHQRMLPTAVAEVLEAAGKLGFGLCLALLAKRQGEPAPIVAAYAIFGITAGLALSAIFLFIRLLVWRVMHRNAQPQARGELPTRRRVLTTLVGEALPITVSASVMSIVSLIDTAMISNRLQGAGFAPAAAHALYSAYGNLAVPLYNLVPSLLSPVTLALMPLLGASFAKGDRKGGAMALTTALRLSLLIAIPAALGLGVFARPILSLIYRNAGEAIGVAAPALSLLAAAVIPAVLIGVIGSALQATGHTLLPVVAMGAGALIKLTLEICLLPVAGIYIYAAPASTLVCNLAVLLIEGVALARVLQTSAISVGDLLRPLLAAAVAVGGSAALYLWLAARFGEQIWQMPLALLLAAMLYLFFALQCRAVGEDELLALPRGEQLCRVLARIKLLK